MIFITGGAGFTGAHFVLDWMRLTGEPILNIDKLSYAANLEPLAPLETNPRYHFKQLDICDTAAIIELMKRHRPRAIVNFAAETHVDRSIDSPLLFVRTNTFGTASLLEASRAYLSLATGAEQVAFRFVQVSTDEVFGSATDTGESFHPHSAFSPNSPYSASKAGADHLVRAYWKTYRLATLSTHSSNNYGPWQYPEKLIPTVVQRATHGLPIPIYGCGHQVRDWLHVSDHCAAVRAALEKGTPGQRYLIGTGKETTNLDLVSRICEVLDELRPVGSPHRALIHHIHDRPGHDECYSLDTRATRESLEWSPKHTLESTLKDVITWYLENPTWLNRFPLYTPAWQQHAK